jgi:hypothetical protein
MGTSRLGMGVGIAVGTSVALATTLALRRPVHAASLGT